MAPASRIAAEVFHGKAYQLRASAHNAIACFRRSALAARGPHRMRVRDGLGSMNGPRGAVHNGVLRSGLRRRVLWSMGGRGVFRSQLMDRRSSVFTSALSGQTFAACLGATFRTDVCWQSLNLQDARAYTGEATTPTDSPRQQATNMARMRKLHLALGMEVLSQGMRAEIRLGASDCRHQVYCSAITSIRCEMSDLGHYLTYADPARMSA